MANYRMEDGTVVKTENAKNHWAGESDHDGRNFIQRSTRDQWLYQDLYESRKGNRQLARAVENRINRFYRNGRDYRETDNGSLRAL